MMPIFLAAADEEYSVPSLEEASFLRKDQLILFGAILLVVATTLLWAFMFRRKRRRSARREERRHRRHSFARDAAKGVAEIKNYVKERKERGKGHRRREHRPRNPTLAETGGLPPVRPDDPTPPNPPY